MLNELTSSTRNVVNIDCTSHGMTALFSLGHSPLSPARSRTELGMCLGSVMLKLN